MSVLVEINGYYRTIISTISSRNSVETNRQLLREVIEAAPELLRSALDLIYSKRISRIKLTLSQSLPTQCFYAILSSNGSRQYLVMQGYCDCYYFAEDVLSRCTAFTCKHELATLLLEYMDLETYLEGEPVSQLTEDLEETQFLEQMHLLYDE